MFSDAVHATIGVIAGALAIGGYIPYIISIFLGKTKPERSSWIIWTLIGGLLALSYIDVGDIKAIWLPLGYFFGPLIVMFLSFWYGYSTWGKLDTICLTAALLSLVPWYLSQNALLTLLINVLIDSFGAVPTLIKTFKEPETEDFIAWLIFFIANTLQLFAISTWDWSATYPIYLFFLASTMVLFILKGKFIHFIRPKP